MFSQMREPIRANRSLPRPLSDTPARPQRWHVSAAKRWGAWDCKRHLQRGDSLGVPDHHDQLPQIFNRVLWRGDVRGHFVKRAVRRVDGGDNGRAVTSGRQRCCPLVRAERNGDIMRLVMH